MKVYKKICISASHQLDLPYKSPCNRLHGHNYEVEVWLEGEVNGYGMVADFSQVSEVVKHYDHRNLNDYMSRSTCEEFTNLLLADLKHLFPDCKSIRVRVWETPTCYAESGIEL